MLYKHELINPHKYPMKCYLHSISVNQGHVWLPYFSLNTLLALVVLMAINLLSYHEHIFGACCVNNCIIPYIVNSSLWTPLDCISCLFSFWMISPTAKISTVILHYSIQFTHSLFCFLLVSLLNTLTHIWGGLKLNRNI